MMWNPLIPTQFVVANDDDRNPSFNIWDLRNPQYPVATFQNLHQSGILSVSWCLKDPNLVISSAKDARTIVTNFKTGEIVLEFPTDQTFHSVKWSQQLSGKIAAMNNNGDTSILSFNPMQPFENQKGQEPIVAKLLDVNTPNGPQPYAPKWLFPKSGARFGFGGKLITFQGKCLKMHTSVVDPSESSMSKLVENFDKEL